MAAISSFFIPCILPPCQNMAPSLPTIQLDCWQLGWRWGAGYRSQVISRLSNSTPQEIFKFSTPTDDSDFSSNLFHICSSAPQHLSCVTSVKSEFPFKHPTWMRIYLTWTGHKLQWCSTSRLPSRKCKLFSSPLSFFHTVASHQSPASSLWEFPSAVKIRQNRWVEHEDNWGIMQ